MDKKIIVAGLVIFVALLIAVFFILTQNKSNEQGTLPANTTEQIKNPEQALSETQNVSNQIRSVDSDLDDIEKILAE